MSLGWQTESSLLPKSSKKIKVDDGNLSMLALKAVVYKKEKEQKANSSDKQNHYKKVKAINNNNSNSNSNTTNIKRNNNEENDNISMAALKAKAHLYDQLSRGIISQPIGDNFLINFDDKKLIQSDSNIDNSKDKHSNNNNNDDNDFIEITDHFGRTRKYNKNSNEYDDYKLSEDLKNKQQSLQQKRKRFQGDDEFSSNQYGVSSSSSSNKWQWSRGENHDTDHVNEYVNNEDIKRAYQNVVDDRIDHEVSRAAKVKTKWDETLNNSSKQYIHEIHKEESIITGSKQGTTENSNTSKDDRRALLLIRQQQKKIEIDKHLNC